MRKALVVGGSNGIGLSIATELARNKDFELIYIVDKNPILPEYENKKFSFRQFDLKSKDYSIFDNFYDIDTLMITAGFGRLALFRDIEEQHIIDSFNVNTISALRLINKFYPKLEAEEDFYCGVMVSIAGYMSSPFFSVYGATKAALKIFIESVNVELEGLAKEIISHLEAKDDLYIPQYEEVFKQVLQRYHDDFRAEGLHSYEYKLKSGRMK